MEMRGGPMQLDLFLVRVLKRSFYESKIDVTWAGKNHLKMFTFGRSCYDPVCGESLEEKTTSGADRNGCFYVHFERGNWNWTQPFSIINIY